MTRPPTPVGIEHVQHLSAALAVAGPAVATATGWGRQLAGALGAGARLFAAGNGGSAAQAAHLTAELVGRYRDDRRPFSAVALHAEVSALTAITNDYGQEEGFARQLEAHARPGDVAVLLSTSGGSPNVVRAAHRARECGVTCWAMTGRGPNALTELADDSLTVESPFTATVQELHLVLLHVLCAGLDAELDAQLLARSS
ncbi:D-sedoheptulose-7-phosphate isomerase [Klenkia terrae]|uniref:SIS domain-containing protein n=1 Tax=Klenkia terrae TaxID=1052259 RepID=A0ABU8EEV0_9ACTN|nr:SIS domain-containing protein [Klenkia terrae]